MESSPKWTKSKLPGFVQLLIFVGVLALGFWLFTSCTDSMSERQEKRNREIYEEAYDEGWYAGQAALIEYIRDYTLGESGDPEEMALDLLNGDLSKKEFVKKYGDFLDMLRNMDPVER